MNVHTARILLVRHRQDFNRDRLSWLPGNLYRLWREAVPSIQDTRKAS